MTNDILLRNIDPQIWKEFRQWCIEQGIPTAGRKSQTGALVCEIIRQHIEKDGEDTKNKIQRLRDLLDRNVIPKRSYYAPPKFIDTIVIHVMKVHSPNLIKHYASLAGYDYERKRRMYKVPERATPSVQARLGKDHHLEPEAEKVLEITMQHAEEKRADSVRSTSSDQEDRPGSSPGPRTAGSKMLENMGLDAKGHKRGKPRAANHPMPSCPGCKLPVHSRQSSTEIKSKGEVWHDECYNDRKVKL